jgi:hypothetical protein
MALSKALVETELSQRLKSALGTFTTTADLTRLQFAYLSGLRKIWHAKEWRFKNKTATVVTTAAQGSGPYAAPADFYKLAQELQIYRFAHDDNQILAPVKDTLTASYFLWIDVQTSGLWFVSAPGDATLTLNYQPGFDNDVANIAATIAVFPSSLMDALYYFTKANMYEDLPQFEGLVPGIQQQGMNALEAVWQDYNQGQTRQRQMAPRGLNGGVLDGMADPVPLRGPQRWWRRF